MEDRKNSTKSISRFFTVDFAAVLISLALIFSLLIQFIPLSLITEKGGTITELYYADNMSETHLEIIQRFNELYSGKIRIIPVDLPFSKFTTNERKELLARSLRSRNNRIDIFSVDLIWVSRFRDWALPLKSFFSRDEISGVLSEALDRCYTGNDLVCIPMYLDAGLFYYREDVLEKQGRKGLEIQKWDELKDLDKNSYVFQGRAYEGLMCNFYDLFSAYRAGGYEDSTAMLKTLSFFRELVESGTAPAAALDFDETGSYTYAMKNDIPIFRAWYSQIADPVLKNEFPAESERLRYSLLPRAEGGRRAATWGGWNVMVSSQTEHPYEAVLFLKFILSDEIQQMIWDRGRYIPVVRSFFSNLDDGEKEFFRQLFAMGVHRPGQPDYTLQSDNVVRLINRTIAGKTDIVNAAQNLLEMLDW